jgi:hypothetical protein
MHEVGDDVMGKCPRQTLAGGLIGEGIDAGAAAKDLTRNNYVMAAAVLAPV